MDEVLSRLEKLQKSVTTLTYATGAILGILIFLIAR